MPVRKTGAANLDSAKLGGWFGGRDGQQAFRTLHSKGGAIASDSRTTSIGGVTTTTTRSGRHADGSARTNRQAGRDLLSRAWKKLTRRGAKLREAAPRAGQLKTMSERRLLGRDNLNPRDLSRLQTLVNRPQQQAPAVNNVPAIPGPQQRTLAARGQLNALRDQIGNATDTLRDELRDNHDDIVEKQETYAGKTMLGRAVDWSTKSEIDSLRLANRTKADQLNRLGNDALNRLSNLETTLKGANNGQLVNNDATTLDAARRDVLGRMMEARLPGLRTDPNAQIALPNGFNNLLNQHQNDPAYDELRQARTDFGNANTNQAKMEALQKIDAELDKLRGKDATQLTNNITGLLVGKDNDRNFDRLRSLVAELDAAGVSSPEAKKEALAALKSEVQSLGSWRLFGDRLITENARDAALQDINARIDAQTAFDAIKGSIATQTMRAATADTVDKLVELEKAHGQDADYQKMRGAILNSLTRFGSTRDWAESSDPNQKRMAAESLNALVSSVRDGKNLDLVLGGDKRFDSLVARLKIDAETRRINNDNNIPLNDKNNHILRQRALIEAEQKLLQAQRKLAAQLEVRDSDHVHSADATLLKQSVAANRGRGKAERDGKLVDIDAHTGTGALKGTRTKRGRLFTGHSMGDVRMDAQFLKAVRGSTDQNRLLGRQGGAEDARKVDLLLADVRRKQDALDALKKQANPNAPLTQAESDLQRYNNLRLAGANTALTDAQQRRQQLTNQRNLHQQNAQANPALTEQEAEELQALPQQIIDLTQERDAWQEEVDAGVAVPDAPARDRHGNWQRQVAAERQRQQGAKTELGAYSDYGIDKDTAKTVFGDKGGLVSSNNRSALRDDTSHALQDEADPKKANPVYDQEQKQLVQDSIDKLINNHMRSTDDALAAQNNINRVAAKMFSGKSNVIAQQIEVSSDFSPEVRANEFTRAVLQTYAGDNDTLMPGNNQMQTRLGQLGQELQADKAAYDQAVNLHGNLSDQRNRLNIEINTKRTQYDIKREQLIKLENQEKINQKLKNENQKSNDKQPPSKLEDLRLEVNKLDNEINNLENRQQELNEQITQQATTRDETLAHLGSQAAQAEQNMLQEIGRNQVDPARVADFENEFSQTLAQRKTRLDERPQAQQANNGQPLPARMNHKDLVNVLRAAVLAGRPKGTRLDEYNPVDHLASIEGTLQAWGITPADVRPELEDIMSTSLDKNELARWQSEFKPDDTSKGAGDKRYSGSASKVAKRPFMAAARADHSNTRVRTRLDQQVRRMNAQIDELVPGSVIRLTKTAAREIDAEGNVALTPALEIEAGITGNKSNEDEIEISCDGHEYQLELKPGGGFSIGGSLGATFGVSGGGVAAGAGVSLGVDRASTKFSGIVLSFKHSGDPASMEQAKQKMQTTIERMAKGDELDIDDFNSLCDSTSLILENQVEWSLQGTGSASLGATANALDSGLSAQAGLSATGVKTKRSKSQTIVDSDTTTVKDERWYEYQMSVAGTASFELGVGAEVKDPTLGDLAHNPEISKELKPKQVSKIWEQVGVAGADQDLGGGKLAEDTNLGVSLGGTLSTTWTRQAFARSSISTDSTTGLIQGAELNFLSSMDGLTLEKDEHRQTEGMALLKRLGKWAGHETAVNAIADANPANNDVTKRLNEAFRQTSGTDLLALRLELKPSKIDEANMFIAQANDLEDPSKGAVTPEKVEEAKLLREQAKAIVDDRSNYIPKAVNLMPAQDDTISRKSPWIPIVSDVAERAPGRTGAVVNSALKMTGLVADPAIEWSGNVGKRRDIEVNSAIKGTMVENAQYMQFFANVQSLDTEEVLPVSPFNGNGDAPVV